MNARLLSRVALVGLLASSFACSTEGSSETTSLSPSQHFAESPAPGLVRDVQLFAGEEYGIEARRGVFTANNQARDLSIRFLEQRVELETTAARVALHLQSVGREGRGAPVENGERIADANRIDYERDVLDEWYLNGPLGLQQGITLSERPAGDGLLEAVVEVEHLRPVLVGTDIELQDSAGVSQLFYGGLAAIDADGARLNAALATIDGAIVIRVDDGAARYPVIIDPIVVTELATLTASDAAPLDEFGGTPAATSGGPTVAIDGTTALVAATYDETRAGGVYVFTQDGAGAWAEEAKLARPAAANVNARFGFSVAIEGDVAVVGAPLPLTIAGSAYVYTRSGGVWTLADTLSEGNVGDLFGSSVAISGDTIVVGARYGETGGAAYVFRQSGMTWAAEATLEGADTAALDDFGSSVDVDGDTIAVGSVFHPLATRAGAVYIFTRAGAVWSQATKLVAADAAPLDLFGRSLQLIDGSLIVGAPQNEVSVFSQGAAYVFRGSAASWSEERLVATAPLFGDQLGYSVAISPGLAAAGARFGDVAALTDAGRVHLFGEDAGAFGDETIYTRPGAAADERFGDSVALSATTLVIGAPFVAARAGAANIAALCDGCVIDGVCRADGVSNPANGCEVCDSAADTSDWTNAADGSACDDGLFCTTGDMCMSGMCQTFARDCDDGLSCTTDGCDDAVDACTNVIAEGCLIGGACVASAAINGANVCESCDPSVSTSTYSARPDDTRCGDPVCADGNLTTAATCSAGACTPGTTSECPGMVACLDAMMCEANCTDDDMCAAGSYCDVGGSNQCTPTLPQGGTCERNGMCTGAVCADGVCCESTCGGTCEACDLAGSKGTCAAVPVDTDPADECELSCDGMRACQSEMPDAGVDGGGDAGSDAGPDAGDAGSDNDAGADNDAGSDAGVDAGVDAMGADTGADSGMTGPGGVSGGGCGVHQTSRGAGWIAFLVLGLALRRRRA